MAAQCHGLVAMDAKGEVIRPVKLWNDTTSAPQASALVDRFGVEWWVRTVGSVPTAAFTITKLAWMAVHEAELLHQVRAVCVPHDWLTYKLTGRHVTDRSDASGTGYFSIDGAWAGGVAVQHAPILCGLMLCHAYLARASQRDMCSQVWQRNLACAAM